ncbi:glycosyltransferase family 2 protein [Aerococcaceae bacterium zg-ZJ1578]|uniref:glycosyltransferase PgfS n=1 Tax=Aerococcaceae bacterium zg-252 TaxID=2796928 RepID=UPI001A23FFA5|nr:glycosyltransferase family 2 protein [Aerococcaceae bacterium zg-1578]
MKMSIMVPFYNEEGMIQLTHSTIVSVLDEMVNRRNQTLDDKIELEFVYVNDGSRDNTFQLMKEIASTDERVKYVSFSRNFGKDAATIAGLRYATGDIVVMMDGDLQHPPQVVEQMLDAYFEGYDVVSARRTREGEDAKETFFAKWFYRLSNSMMDVKLTDGVSEFRLFSRKAVNAVLALPEYNRFAKGLFSWIGFKEKIVEYPNQVREVGVSKFGVRRNINYAIQGILSFNDKPLRICIKTGLFCVTIAVLYLIWMFISWLINPNTLVSGYFTTLFAIVLFGGVQLISIGVLGEYIGKIYYEVKRRPHYLVDESNIESIGKDQVQ